MSTEVELPPPAGPEGSTPSGEALQEPLWPGVPTKHLQATLLPSGAGARLFFWTPPGSPITAQGAIENWLGPERASKLQEYRTNLYIPPVWNKSPEDGSEESTTEEGEAPKGGSEPPTEYGHASRDERWHFGGRRGRRRRHRWGGRNDRTFLSAEGAVLALSDALGPLASLDLSNRGEFVTSVTFSVSLAAWSAAAKLALELLSRHELIPSLTPRQRGFEARWRLCLPRREDLERFETIAESIPPSGRAAPLPQPRGAGRGRGGRHVLSGSRALRLFLDATADDLARSVLEARGSSAPDGGRNGSSKEGEKKSWRSRRGGRGRRGRAHVDGRPWEQRFAEALMSANARFQPRDFLERNLPEELDQWLAPAAAVGTPAPVFVRFSLHLPEGDTEEWTLDFQLEAVEDPEITIPAAVVWESGDEPLPVGARKVEGAKDLLLRALGMAAGLFPPIERALLTSRPEGTALSTAEAWRFLSDVAPLLRGAGHSVRLPQGLAVGGRQRLRARLRLGGNGSSDASEGGSGRSFSSGGLGMKNLVEYRWEVALGNSALGAEEFREVIKMRQPLVRWKGEWVVVAPSDIAEAERLLVRTGDQTSGQMPVGEALALALSGASDGQGGEGLEDSTGRGSAEVLCEGGFAQLVARLRPADGSMGGGLAAGMGADASEMDEPKGFRGKLRPYQRRGLAWLVNLADLQMGACLADDMGLGKTIQLIGLMLHQRNKDKKDARPNLIVCPTSVMGNWYREIQRFAPGFPVVRHHGPSRADTASKLLRRIPKGAAVITTFALARLDRELLSEVDWGMVVLDEAQNVKNPRSQQARAVRSFRAARRVALTGTPVENRLSELWSVFEFLNPGLLGTLSTFEKRLAIPIERYHDKEKARRLRSITAPFLLRRLKTDPGVADDLPSKNEMKVYCSLSEEQAKLYKAILDENLEQVQKAEGIERRGAVLSLLTRLKQVCNHPAHLLKEGDSAKLSNRSGKLDRLVEMLEEVFEEGEYAIVFTQFTEMGWHLVRHLTQRLCLEVPFLHGGVPAHVREEMVRRFQQDEDAPPVFLLSLRAGGTGLNLTRATHVFHFDRWWNPAVEDQATDRAYRIGQKRSVSVHKFICIGTLEERIDKLIQDKKALAGQVVGTGETWLTELSDDEIADLVSLSSEAVT